MPSARTFRAIAIVTTALGVAILLLCGGVIEGPARAVAARYCEVLPDVAAPVSASARGQVVLDQIEQCGAQVQAGTASLEEVATYTAELHEAAADGALNLAEMLVLERVSEDMGQR